jgi:hypothetical protein
MTALIIGRPAFDPYSTMISSAKSQALFPAPGWRSGQTPLIKKFL